MLKHTPSYSVPWFGYPYVTNEMTNSLIDAVSQIIVLKDFMITSARHLRIQRRKQVTVKSRIFDELLHNVFVFKYSHALLRKKLFCF